MEEQKPGLYRIHEFSAMAGVTVRALHHYDRLGLLRPVRQRENRYRLYCESDFGRLEQILVLRFLGLPLKQIRNLLEDESALPSVLQRQRSVLAEKHKRLERTIKAVEAALEGMTSKPRPDWNLFKAIIKEIEMQNHTEWMKKYYSKEAQAKIEGRRNLWSPELQEKVSKAWQELFQDVEAALDADPASPRAQALARRWEELVAGFTGRDPEIQKGLNAMYADQSNWPAKQQPFRIRPEIQDFIREAMKARGGK